MNDQLRRKCIMKLILLLFLGIVKSESEVTMKLNDNEANETLTCSLQVYLPDYKPTQNDDFPRLKTSFIWTFPEEKTVITEKAVCELSLTYEKKSIQDGLGINCQASLQLHNNHEGFYQCTAKLIFNQTRVFEETQKIFLKVEIQSNLSMILAMILVGMVVTFLIVGLALKWAGHQWSWQKTSEEYDYPMPMDCRFNEVYPTRYFIYFNKFYLIFQAQLGYFSPN